MSVWRNPNVVGPVVAALIAAGVAIFWTTRDRKPPMKPVIMAIEREEGASKALVLRYERAEDLGGSGLREVRIWYRLDAETEWTRTDSAGTGPIGEIHFEAPSQAGTYLFDVVATDQVGNASAHPGATDGQKRFIVQARAARVVAPAQPERTEAATAGVETPEGWIHVPVHFHLISHAGDLSRIHRQVAALNEAFFDARFAFAAIRAAPVENSDWNGLRLGEPRLEEMKRALVADPEVALNVYVTDIEGGLLALSSFPWDLAAEPLLDGCIVSPSTLPGGTAPFDEGKTLVHCAGHWLGLYHTFQGGCTPPGDHVADTPAHEGPNFGRPGQVEGCDGSSPAPVHNYMNYGDDASLLEFTSGQIERMRTMTATYRPGLLPR